MFQTNYFLNKHSLIIFRWEHKTYDANEMENIKNIKSHECKPFAL